MLIKVDLHQILQVVLKNVIFTAPLPMSLKSGTMQPIRISVNTENEEDNPSICAKLQLSSPRLTPDLIDLLFWSIIAMCL